MSARRRLDTELVRRGLAASREAAQEAIAAGRVTVGGAVADKPARMVAAGDPVLVAGAQREWASRGGHKLAAALERWGIAVDGRRCLDAGASTGGFTDVLLHGGAAEVWAVDVGRGQLLDRLRRDPRVHVLDRTNIREVSLGDVGGSRFDVVVADLSFISLRTVAGALVELAADGADLVVLVKPQFEVGRAAASAGKGVIRDPALWSGALTGVGRALESERAAIMGAMTSPIRGTSGNVEFLLWARMGADQSADLDVLVRAAVEDPRVTAVGLVVHHGRDIAASLAEKAASWLSAEGHLVRVGAGDAVALPALAPWSTDETRLGGVDVLISVGGDGTMLRAVRLAAGAPILGVNVGHLGYLTEVEPNGWQDALRRVLAGDYAIEERMTLSVAPAGVVALNDAVIEKEAAGHTIRVGVSISGRSQIEYTADGLIVATPTGSTAYNLSAGGPLASPRVEALLVTPVAAHSVFGRTVVVAPDDVVRVSLLRGSAVLSVDGQHCSTLEVGDEIECRAAPTPARLITFGERDFWKVITAKLGLSPS